MQISFDRKGRPTKASYPRYIFKYCSINDNSLRAIRESYLWFSSVDDFNDPFELTRQFDTRVNDDDFFEYISSPRAWQMMLDLQVKATGKTRDELEREAKEELLPQKDKIISDMMSRLFADMAKTNGICCMSEVCDNVLMWSHYSKNSRGICLVFDYRELYDPARFFALKVRYLKRVPKFNYIKHRLRDLRSDDPNMQPESNRRFDQEIFGTKTADWAYEKEHRLVSFERGKNHYPPQALKGIILGGRISNADLAKVVIASINSKSRPELDAVQLDHKTNRMTVSKFKNREVREKVGAFVNLSRLRKAQGKNLPFEE